MKQKDIATIIVVAAVAGLIAFILSNMFLATDDYLQSEVEKVESISAEFSKPDERFLNKEAINPTRLISIEENENINPFQ